MNILTGLFLDSSSSNPIGLITEEETRKCIVSFKNGKAPDEHGITIEHSKYGGQPIVQVTKLVNCIFANHYLPSNLKSGISYPVHKNGGKPKDEPNSYRKITVTSTIGKIVEKLHLSRNQNNIREIQSRL